MSKHLAPSLPAGASPQGLISELRADGARALITFAGQGIDFMSELVELHAAGGVARQLVELSAARTEVLARHDAFVLSGLHEHGYDLKRWLERPETRPPEAYLQSTAVSIPLIFAAQVARYAQSWEHGLSQVFARGGVAGITGHSQGIVAALLVAERTDGGVDSARFAQLIEVLLWEGLHMAQSYHDALRDVGASADQPPMVAVSGPDLATLEALVAQVNRGQSPAHHLVVSLQNGRTRNVVSGPPALVAGLHQALTARAAKDEANKKAGRLGGRPLRFTWEPLSVGGAYHGPMMARGAEAMRQTIKRVGFSLDAAALRYPVFASDGSGLMNQSADLTEQFVQCQFLNPVRWNKTLVESHTVAPYAEILDFGPADGVARLSAAATRGLGVRVHAQATSAGRVSAWVTPSEQLERALDYRAFMPSLATLADSSVVVSNRFSRITGRSPAILPGMTPTTVDVPIVAAAANAGYLAELAGGGQVTEAIFRRRCAELAEALDPGQEVVFNGLYLDPYLWDLHIRKTGLVQQLRREGAPICGVTISAGVPELKEAVALLDELAEAGLWLNAFKPGSVEQIRQVCAIAQAAPQHTVFVHVEGGKAGGHHSWEELEQLLLETYHQLRACENVVLCVGGGIATEARGVELLTGRWSLAHGQPAMPVDAILLGTVTMAAREASATRSVKEALVGAGGEPGWVFAGDVRGGVTSGKSQLNADIHYLDNAASRAGRLLDEVAGDAAKVAARREEIIEALSRTCKPYFGDLERMTYQAALERVVSLMAIGEGSAYEDGVWLDRSHRMRVFDLVRRFEARLVAKQEGAFEPQLRDAAELDEPASVVARFLAAYPSAATVTLHPLDAEFFVHEVCGRPGKPVNFVPVIDGQVRRWYKSDSLWQAQHSKYTADQVLIIPGPEAVGGIATPDEPVAAILARFDRALVAELGEPVASAAVALPERLRVSPDALAAHGLSGALVRVFEAARVFDGRAMVENPARALCRANSGFMEIVQHEVGVVRQAFYEGEAGERVELSVSGERVLVVARPKQTPLEGFAAASLSFELVAHQRGVGSYVALDGAAYHLAVQRFYQLALFGRELAGAALHEVSRVEVEVSAEAVRGYGRVTQLGGLAEGEAPMPYGFSLAWEAIFGALSAPELAPGLLKLVHLSNRFEAGAAWPLVAGQRVESRAWVVRVADDARGRSVEVRSELWTGGALALGINSVFYVRESFAHLPLGAAVSERRHRDNVDIIHDDVRDVEGRTLAQVRGVSPGTMVPFSRIGADRNPIHSSPLMARMAGLDGCIVHGMWTAARAYASLVDDALGGSAARLASFEVSFTSPCMPSELLQITTKRVGARSGARQVWQVEVAAQRGDAREVVMRAEALIRPPRTAYVFPGQGIQQRGMGMDGYARSRASRAVWDRADAFTRRELGFSILAVVRDNPAQLEIRGHRLVHERGVLHLTQLTQVAMAVLSLAQVAEIKEAGLLQEDAIVCGHSVGEYNALGSLEGVLPMEVVVRTVYERGLAMHRLVPRDEHGESGYRMGVIRPHYVGMNEQQARELVQRIAGETGLALEIVNYNIVGRQYSVVGRIEAIAALREALDAMPQRGGQGKSAWVDVPGVDVPFHSRVLSDGVAPFRATLEERFPQELPIERLLGHYIPNLVPRPFSLDRAFIEEVQGYTRSAPLAEVLVEGEWEAWSATPQRLARRLLIELLSWQFASPVRWIETQDLLMRPRALGGLGVERIVEIGVGYQPTLTSMARYTKELIGAVARDVQVLNCEADADALFLRDGDAEVAAPVEAAPVAAPSAAAPSEAAPVATAAPVAQVASNAAPMADEPLTVREALRALLATQARLRPEQLDAKETIDEVFEGVSSRRNQVLLDIGAEFGLGTIDGAHEKPLADLEAEIGRRASRYTGAGRYLKATVDEALKNQLGRAGMGRKEAAAYLEATWGMGPKLADAALVQLALGRRDGESSRGGALAVLGSQAVQDRAGAQAVLDAAAQALGAARGVAVAKRGGGAAGGGAVDSAVVDALAERIVGAQGVLMQTARDMADHLGHKLDASTPAQQADAAALARLEMLEREHGAEYAQMIAPMFDALKHVAFISPWAWRQRDVAKLAFDGLAGRVDDGWHRRAQRLTHRPGERERSSAAWFARWVAQRGASVEVVDALEQIRDARGDAPHAWAPARPALFEEGGELRYEEREDRTAGARGRFVESLRIGQPGAFVAMSEAEQSIAQVLEQACEGGFSLRGRVALVTGASPGSIALEMVAQLLHSGAIVVVTTTTYNKTRLRFYRKFYQDHASEGAELHVVPCNQGSSQDIEALVSWLFSTVTEQSGALVKVLKRPMAPDLVLPFGAIKDLATLDQLGSAAEAAMRAMLLNVERLVARIAVTLRAHGMPERPCHVVLPLSPNHGAFGGDGAYAETKAGLEVLLEKWASEREAWGEGVTLCGARIGWVRGTGLMVANNLVSPGLEERTGVRTFSNDEMAFLLTALCTDEARDAARLKPLRADLTGGFGEIEDLKGVVSQLRAEVEERASALRRAASAVQGRAVTTLDALPSWPAATFAQPSMRLPSVSATVPLEQMVVLVGAGEVGPFGSSRTRFAFEVQDELSAAAVLELAWTCGLVRYEAGERGGSWVDGETGEEVAEAQIAPRYRSKLTERIGIRFVEPETLGLDPRALPVMSTAYLERDMTFSAASEAEAREFERQDPERTVVVFDAEREQWRVTRRAGSMVRVPRAVRLDRDVAGVVPKGYDLARYGIPRDMIENTDRLALYNLIATVEAFLSAGMTPEELLARVHPARVANTQGSGIGGMRSLQRLYWDHLLGSERQKDILQETLINVVAAYVVQSYVGSYGAMSHPVAACATAAVSVEEGVDKILAGKADFVVAGGFDDIGREGMVGFADMNATANADEMRARGLEPDEFSRANDVRRRGFVEAQGGGTMLLARGDVAARLGLPVRAVVAYAGSFSDGIQKSIPAPGLGAIACVLGKERSPLAMALARFGLTTDAIGVVYKHDTSTQANDPNENRLHQAIQTYLDRTQGNPLWVVSQKSITGHAKGGSAAWQAIGLAQVLATGVIPGNKNLDAVDPAMGAFGHMAFTDAALDAGPDALEAGLLTSLGFGHVSGIVLLLHPRHFIAQVPEAERAAYMAQVREREAFEQRGLIEAMIGRSPLYERRAERRFEGADGSEQQHAEEIALLTQLAGRMDLETGRYTVEEPRG